MGFLNKLFGVETRLKNKGIELVDLLKDFQSHINSENELKVYLESKGFLYQKDYDNSLIWVIELGIDKFIFKWRQEKENANNKIIIKANEEPLNPVFIRVCAKSLSYAYSSPYHLRPDTINEYCSLFIDGLKSKNVHFNESC